MINAEFFIIHFNDVYDIEEQSREPVGGASRFIYTVKHIKQHFKHVLTLFSGDLFSPSTLSNIYKGSQMILPFNQIGVDVACLGNHDFDFQLPQLQKLMAETKTPWLLSNVKNSQTGRLLADALQFYIKEINGFKIGFIGLAEKEWLGEIDAIPFDVMEYICYQETADKLIKDLRNEQCDFIIALTHMRVPNDVNLIESLPKGFINIVLGGHDHQWLKRKVRETFYAKSGTNFRNLGLYRVGLSENKEWFQQFRQSFQYVELNDIVSFTLDNPITQRKYYVDALPMNILSSIPKDLEIEHFVQDQYKDYQQKTQKVIAYTKAPLETRFAIVRTTETGALNFFTDVVRLEFQTDVAFINSGTIRADDYIPEGPITYQTLDRIFAIPDAIVVAKITGKQLYGMLENSVSKLPALDGRFIGVSGVEFKFNKSLPSGQRIDLNDIKINGKPIILDSVYTLATKSYLADGYDGYEPITENILISKFQDHQIKQVFLNFFDNIRREIGVYEHKENFVTLDKLQKDAPQILVEQKYLRFREVIDSIQIIDKEPYIIVNPQIMGRIIEL